MPLVKRHWLPADRQGYSKEEVERSLAPFASLWPSTYPSPSLRILWERGTHQWIASGYHVSLGTPEAHPEKRMWCKSFIMEIWETLAVTQGGMTGKGRQPGSGEWPSKLPVWEQELHFAEEAWETVQSKCLWDIPSKSERAGISTHQFPSLVSWLLWECGC